MGVNEFVQIGTKIKRARKNKGYSQKQMAQLCEMPYSTYSNYENNNREPGTEQLEKITRKRNDFLTFFKLSFIIKIITID